MIKLQALSNSYTQRLSGMKSNFWGWVTFICVSKLSLGSNPPGSDAIYTDKDNEQIILLWLICIFLFSIIFVANEVEIKYRTVAICWCHILKSNNSLNHCGQWNFHMHMIQPWTYTLNHCLHHCYVCHKFFLKMFHVNTDTASTEECSDWFYWYHRTSNMSHTKFQKLTVSRLVLQLSLHKTLKLCVKSSMKI